MIRRNFLKFCGAAIPLGFLGIENTQAEVKGRRDLVLRFSKIWKEIFPNWKMACYECIDDPTRLLYFNSLDIEGRIFFESWDEQWWLLLGVNTDSDPIKHFDEIKLGKDLYDEKMWRDLPEKIKESVSKLHYITKNKIRFYANFHEQNKEVMDELNKGKWESWGKYLPEDMKNRLEKTGKI